MDFPKQWRDKLLLFSVLEKNTHRAEHGKKQEIFEQAMQLSVSKLAELVFRASEAPCAKSLRDRYFKIEEDWGKVVTFQMALSLET